mmetsp:Transcript_91172/g.263029  ORF Transcript_91172/g.263029 Transcript_91172/m.263029 type:complete len:621 (+) Transcript_91172:100-1962(+)
MATSASVACADMANMAPYVDEKFEPRPGDSIHVVGAGSAVVMSCLGETSTYEVRYSTGNIGHVKRNEVMAQQPSYVQGLPPQGVEYLGRPFNDAARTLQTPAATFALIASTIGGSILSLPYAMNECGIVLGVVMFAITAIFSGWTLDMLVECARRTGHDSYELVGHAAFGERCRKLAILLVFLTTWTVQIAFLVLMQDLLTPIVELVLPGVASSLGRRQLRIVVAIAAVAASAPMCYKSSLGALRGLCFASVGSILLVTLILAHRTAASFGAEHEIHLVDGSGISRTIELATHLPLWPKGFMEALYVFPVVGVSFQCHFNVLPTHMELQRPTQSRMRRIISLTSLATSSLYICVGVAGVAWAGDAVCGNILLNFARDDPLIVVGRLCLGLMLVLNFPLYMQPSRNALFRLVAAGGPCMSASAVMDDEAASCGSAVELPLSSFCAGQRVPRPSQTQEGGIENGARSPRMSAPRVHVYRSTDVAGFLPRGRQVDAIDSFPMWGGVSPEGSAEPTVLQRSAMTTAILLSCLMLGVLFQSILVVFSVIGSSMAAMLVFVLPAAFWYKLLGPRAGVKRHFVRAFLGIFVVLTVACTFLTVRNLGSPACPAAFEKLGLKDASGLFS